MHKLLKRDSQRHEGGQSGRGHRGVLSTVLIVAVVIVIVVLHLTGIIGPVPTADNPPPGILETLMRQPP